MLWFALFKNTRICLYSSWDKLFITSVIFVDKAFGGVISVGLWIFDFSVTLEGDCKLVVELEGDCKVIVGIGLVLVLAEAVVLIGKFGKKPEPFWIKSCFLTFKPSFFFVHYTDTDYMDPDEEIRTRIAILRNGLSILRNGLKKVKNYMRTTDRP